MKKIMMEAPDLPLRALPVPRRYWPELPPGGPDVAWVGSMTLEFPPDGLDVRAFHKDMLSLATEVTVTPVADDRPDSERLAKELDDEGLAGLIRGAARLAAKAWVDAAAGKGGE